jgi:hypothetical protein
MNWKRTLRPTWARLTAFSAFLVVGFLFTEHVCADVIGPARQHIDRCWSHFGPFSGLVWWLLLPIGAYLLATLVTWRTDSSRGKGAV